MSNLLTQVAQPPKYRSTFIYALVDPRNQAIRYVGKSVRPKVRFTAHMAECNLKPHSHKNLWIRSLVKLGLKPELEILDEIDYRDDWIVEEKRWIARLRSLTPGYPPLTNATDGGEGVNGWVMPEDVRKKISDANRGVLKSAETRILFSKGQRNRWDKATDEEKQKMLGNLRTPWPEEKRKKRSADARKAPRKANSTSQYLNVIKLKNTNGEKCWRAACVLSGKFKMIGLFYTEIEAAHARDRFVLTHIGEDVPLNFPRAEYDNLDEIVAPDIRPRQSRTPKNNTLGYKGIHKNGKNGWAANINYMGIRHRLGTHRTMESAARAYDRKAIELFGDFARTNFPRSQY